MKVSNTPAYFLPEPKNMLPKLDRFVGAIGSRFLLPLEVKGKVNKNDSCA